jgi:hypothetical protein
MVAFLDSLLSENKKVGKLSDTESRILGEIE